MTIKQYLADINPGFIDQGTFVLVFPFIVLVSFHA